MCEHLQYYKNRAASTHAARTPERVDVDEALDWSTTPDGLRVDAGGVLGDGAEVVGAGSLDDVVGTGAVDEVVGATVVTAANWKTVFLKVLPKSPAHSESGRSVREGASSLQKTARRPGFL